MKHLCTLLIYRDRNADDDNDDGDRELGMCASGCTIAAP